MSTVWHKPTYLMKSATGKDIVIDVTLSSSSGLPPHKVIRESVISFFKDRRVETVLDFGAGAIRQSMPLLDRGFQVCAVEYEEQFKRPGSAKALEKARKNANFSTLIYPRDFKNDTRRFDAVLLCYVLQVMPEPKERDLVLSLIKKKLRDDGYVLYMSRYGQMPSVPPDQKVSDGIFTRPGDKSHSFYREFTTEETHATFKKLKLSRIRSLSERGTEQIFMYNKGKLTWV